MSLIKYIGKLLSKYHDVQDLEKIAAKPSCSNMIATTTIINQKKISRVIHSYPRLGHSFVRIHKKSHKRRFYPKPIPLAESSAIGSQTLCNSCMEKKPIRKYCKCCGKSVKSTVSKKCVVWLEDRQHLYKHRQINAIGRNDKFKNVAVRDKNHRCCLKKSKAMTNIKQIEYKSFLSNKRKYSSTLSSTWQDDIDHRRKQTKENNFVVENFGKLEQKINGTFVVDFASTPIKLAPKTSTPVKFRKF